MQKTIDLSRYLPQSIKEYREMQYIVNAENPEFQICENTAEKISNAGFIELADEAFIERYEKMLGIKPNSYDTLDARRSKLLVIYNDVPPYTMKTLEDKLTMICGEGNFTITPNFNNYEMTITVKLPLQGQVNDLEYMLSWLIPANIKVITINDLYREVNDDMYHATVVVSGKRYTIEQEEEF